jgi:hypothetical protein
MLKVQSILQGGSVALEFMTDNAAEAQEIRNQCLEEGSKTDANPHPKKSVPYL